jgi:putative polyhydroxyalkanoate system protein
MPDIEIHRAHHLGLKAARVAAEKMADHLGRKFGLTGEWAGDVLSFQRPGVTGSLTITDKDLALSVSLGFLLKAMKGSIETAIREELDQLFAAAKPKKAPARPKKGR